MGCRLILNLCRVYYHPATAQPPSIWAASEGIRFNPPSPGSAVDTAMHGNWAVEREQSPEPKSPSEGGYELYGLVPLGRTKAEDVEDTDVNLRLPKVP